MSRQVRSLASWLWLVEFPGTAVALDASEDSSGELAAALREHFSTVHVLRSEQGKLEELRAANARQRWTVASETVGSVYDGAWEHESFDCVAVYDGLAHGISATAVSDRLKRYRRLLRPGGWICVASPTPTVLGRGGSNDSGIERRAFTRMLKGAGFQDIRPYWIEYSLDRPLFLVPHHRSTIVAYESHDAMRGAGLGRRRQVVANTGIGSLLYPAYMLLARV
jgi:hypothetical protein